MIDVAVLIVGLALLVKSAELLIQGASYFAQRIGISELVVGLTIVSFGTSMPEFVVSMTSGFKNNPDLAIANVIGSNIANVLLVLGLAAIIRPLPVQDSTVVSEIPFSLAAALLVGFLANAALFSSSLDLSLSHLDGGILLFFFFLFMLYMYKVSNINDDAERPPIRDMGGRRSSIYLLLSIAGLYFGGQWVVDSATGIAYNLGVSDAMIGLTIVAIGTSMPELVASAVAAYRNHTDIAVGNVVGSNIFNLLWILGATASLVELPFEAVSNTDIVMVIASSSLVILALVASRSHSLRRMHGVLFILLYICYMSYVILRG